MKVPYNWLKSYIDFPYSPEELAHQLTMIGLEVEDIEYLGEELQEIVIGQIKKIEEHPDADKLVICKVDIDSEIIQVVTGAPNVKEGIKVPVAAAGTELPGGMKIEKTSLRGKTSEGMICSKDELGLMEERADGIMVLEDEAEVGEKFVKYMGLDEYVLNLDLTPNYARCLGMLGIAREVKALLDDRKINYPEINLKNVSEENINDKINVTIDDPDLCPRYTARLVKNVKIGPSPEWMQQRLQAAGIRPINNVVDITNYVLLEYNQPLHAFDYDKIGEKEIIVRRAREDEELITLDDEKRKLNNEILIIADRDKPVALAGVMGGANSEVTENTQNILIESAYFKPANIRKTARRLGLSSESSYRFERGVDIENLIEANNRAAQLMQEYADAEIVEGVIDNYPGSYSKTTVSLRSKRVNEILGIELDAETMKNLLIKLEFDVSLENLSENDTKMRVDVPSYRNDIEREADIIEEIARMYGYNKIPVTHSESKQEGKKTNPQKIREQIRNIMTASGLDEIITFSLMGKEIYDRLNISRDNKLTKWVEIKNPLNKAFSVMRTSLIPNMIQTLSQNSKRQLQELRFFEIGKVFYDNGRRKRPEEVEMLAGGSMGYTEDIWNNSAPDLFYLKGVIENLFRRLNLDNLNFHKANKPFLHPGRTTEIFYKNKKVGFLGEILPDLIKEFDLSDHTALFQIDLNIIKNEVEPGEQRYVSLPRYPAVSRDLAIVVEKNLPSVKIMNAIKNAAGDLLKDVKLFDLYQGEQIEKDSKSLAYKLLFQAEDRTLTDEEVNKLFKKIIENLKNEFNATIRN